MDAYTKVRDGGAVLREYAFQYNSVDNVPVVNTQTTQASAFQSQDTFSGYRNPYWKSQVRLNLQAGTPASGDSFELDYPFIDHEIRATSLPDRRVIWNNSVVGVPLVGFSNQMPLFRPGGFAPSQNKSSVAARCISNFLSEAKSAQSSFESGQDIGEWHQAVNLVRHPVSSLRSHILSYFSSLKKAKSKYKKAASLKKALSDSYLEFNFGWRPLAFDISDAIAGLGSARLPRVPVKSHARETFFASSTSKDWEVNGRAFTVNTKTIGSYSMHLKGMVSTYRNGKPPSLLQEFQLLPEDFAPTAWDLIPYSFVVDYFANIGDIVRALSFPSSSLSWVNQSTHDDNTLEMSYNPHSTSAGFAYPSWEYVSLGFASSNLKGHWSRFVRSQPSPSSLLPPLVISLPLGSYKPWLNMAALLAGRSSSLTPFFR